MPITIEDTNILGDIINSTWGKSSSPKTTHFISLKCKIISEKVVMLTYTTIETFWTSSQMIAQQKDFDAKSMSVISQYLKEVSRKFKNKSNKTISFKEQDSDTSIEVLNVQSHINTKKDAYYRRKSFFEFEIK